MRVKGKSQYGGIIAILVAGIAPSVALAQEPAYDPPGTRYMTGEKAPSAEVLRETAVQPTFRAFLPVKKDLSSDLPPPGAQLQLGSCQAWAVGYAARSYYAHTQEGRPLSKANFPSPNFLYNVGRTGECKGGSSIDEIVAVLKNGSLSERDYPYSESCSRPDAQTISKATDFKADGFAVVSSEDEAGIRGQIADGNPVILSVWVNDAFEAFRGKATYLSRDPVPSKKSHAIVAVGYDDSRQAVKLINSWGSGWGYKGYMWIDYQSLKAILRGAYTLTVSKPPPPPQPSKPKFDTLLSELNANQCVSLERTDAGLDGFVEKPEQLDQLKALAKEVAVNVDKVAIAPWPQCELRKTLKSVQNEPDHPIIDLGHAPEYVEGDPLHFSVTAPDHFSYLYVSYIQADQTVVSLVQPSATGGQVEPRSKMNFGNGETGQKFTVSPPFGREMVVAISSRSPLFDEPLPATSSARDYLSALRKAFIYKPDPTKPDRVISAASVAVITKGAIQ